MFEIQSTPIRSNCTVLTQLYFPVIKVVQFSTIPPEDFWPSNQKSIVAVWRIKERH
jgi:hypothetical protein